MATKKKNKKYDLSLMLMHSMVKKRGEAHAQTDVKRYVPQLLLPQQRTVGTSSATSEREDFLVLYP